jgi:t-SNARE complex subunit (syntaxin)
VRPDASQQEIQAAIDDDQGGQIFSQAVFILLDLAYDS